MKKVGRRALIPLTFEAPAGRAALEDVTPAVIFETILAAVSRPQVFQRLLVWPAGPLEILADDAAADYFIRNLVRVTVRGTWRAVFIGRANRRGRNRCRSRRT